MTVALVVTNLLYVVGAIVVAALIGGIVAIRHRRPKSVEANVASFNKGLKALAPDDDPSRVGTERPSSWIARRPTVTTRPGGKTPVEEKTPDGSVRTAEKPEDDTAEEASGDDEAEATAPEDDTDDGGTGTEEASTG